MVYSKKATPTGASNKNAHTSIVDCIDENCPRDPDLLLLRDAAADERTAIAFYLHAGHVTCLADLFLKVAEDEMHHFAELIHLINMLDPVQAAAFEKVGLSMMIMPRRPKAKWHPPIEEDCPEEDEEESEISPPDPEDLETIEILSRSIADELLAINKYQKYMEQACHPKAKALFCHLMNEEKEHVAEFTKALFCFTNEPSPYKHN